MRAGVAGLRAAGRAATCAAERPCPPVGRVPWGEGAALPRRPAQRGMLANGRRRSARAIVTPEAGDRPRAPGGASAPSRARPALAGSPSLLGPFPASSPRLAALDQLEQVIQVGTFTKTLSAGLRVG